LAQLMVKILCVSKSLSESPAMIRKR
jgi:hypothetical protein